MIINIEGKNSPYVIKRIECDNFRHYSLRLISLNGIISSYVHGGLYKIETNIIDREGGNSDRVLAYFRLNRKSHLVDYTPTQLVWYKLRLSDFSSLDINLRSITSDEKLYFSEFACQLELIKDERIQ